MHRVDYYYSEDDEKNDNRPYRQSAPHRFMLAVTRSVGIVGHLKRAKYMLEKFNGVQDESGITFSNIADYNEYQWDLALYKLAGQPRWLLNEHDENLY